MAYVLLPKMSERTFLVPSFNLLFKILHIFDQLLTMLLTTADFMHKRHLYLSRVRGGGVKNAGSSVFASAAFIQAAYGPNSSECRNNSPLFPEDSYIDRDDR